MGAVPTAHNIYVLNPSALTTPCDCICVVMHSNCWQTLPKHTAASSSYACYSRRQQTGSESPSHNTLLMPGLPKSVASHSTKKAGKIGTATKLAPPTGEATPHNKPLRTAQHYSACHSSYNTHSPWPCRKPHGTLLCSKICCASTCH